MLRTFTSVIYFLLFEVSTKSSNKFTYWSSFNLHLRIKCANIHKSVRQIQKYRCRRQTMPTEDHEKIKISFGNTCINNATAVKSQLTKIAKAAVQLSRYKSQCSAKTVVLQRYGDTTSVMSPTFLPCCGSSLQVSGLLSRNAIAATSM